MIWKEKYIGGMDAKKSEEWNSGTDRPVILPRQADGLNPYKSHLCLH